MFDISLIKIIYKFSPVAIHPFMKKVESSNIGARLVGGAFWSIIGNIVSRSSLLLSLIIIARILGQNEYGKIGIVRSTIGMFMVFACFAMSAVTTKFVSQYREVSKSKTGSIIFWSIASILGIGGAVTLLLWIISPFVASNFLSEPSLTPLLRIASFILLFVALDGVFQGVLVGFETLKAIAIANIISGTISLPCFIFLSYYMGGVGAIFGFLVRIVLQVVCLAYLTMHELRARQITLVATHKRECFGMLFSFGLPVFVGGLVSSFSFWVANVILVRQCGYEDMAIFDVANQYRVGVLALHSAAVMIVLPVFSNLLTHNKECYDETTKKMLTINAILALVIISFLAIFSPWLMSLFGESYNKSYLVLIFLGITAGLGIVCDIYKKIVASQGRVLLDLVATSIMGSVLLLASFFLAKYGAIGISISYVLSFLSFLAILVLLNLTKKSIDRRK